MDIEVHEAVWNLGAVAGRDSGDVEGAFLDAVKKHGAPVFPSRMVREDDWWFEEYFAVFREGFDSTKH